MKCVGGETTRFPTLHHNPNDEYYHAKLEWTNSTFDELSREVLESGLAEDLTEARTLIIPAFNHYGLLPTGGAAGANSDVGVAEREREHEQQQREQQGEDSAEWRRQRRRKERGLQA